MQLKDKRVHTLFIVVTMLNGLMDLWTIRTTWFGDYSSNYGKLGL